MDHCADQDLGQDVDQDRCVMILCIKLLYISTYTVLLTINMCLHSLILRCINRHQNSSSKSLNCETLDTDSAILGTHRTLCTDVGREIRTTLYTEVNKYVILMVSNTCDYYAQCVKNTHNFVNKLSATCLV